MNRRERRSLMVVVGLFSTLFVIVGGSASTLGIFFTPLMIHFHWTHSQVSLIAAVFGITWGVASPLVGWLLDTIDARIIMPLSASIAGVGFILASSAGSLATMLACYGVVALGVAGSALVPCSVVAANWFSDRRAMALGIVIAGGSAGGVVMPLVTDRIISAKGWSAAMLVIAALILVLLVPLIIFTVRTRPREETGAMSQAAVEADGIELNAAFRTASFWMLVLMQVCAGTGLNGAFIHLVPYLISVGFSSSRAALIASAQAGFVALGVLLLGALADRCGARPVLAAALAALGLGILFLLGVRGNGLLLGAFLVAFGLGAGATSSVAPLLLAEVFGLKRFGSLAGLMGMLQTAGAAAGPVLVGEMFDLNGSYAAAFAACFILLCVAAFATLLVKPVADQLAVAA